MNNKTAEISTRTYDNSRIAPCTLPTEILALCFLHLAAIDEPDGYTFRIPDNDTVNVNRLGWIRVLHVCSRFRAVALQEPRLWSHISFSRVSPPWAVRMISLSKRAPLHISGAHILPQCREIAQQTIRDEIARVKSLRIYDNVYEIPYLLRGATEPALILESLELTLSFTTESDDRFLPANLFGLQAPLLRRVAVSGFKIPPSHFGLLSSVIDLSIRMPRFTFTPTQSSIALNDLRSMLQVASRIERLELANCLPCAKRALNPQPTSSTSPEISFPIDSALPMLLKELNHLRLEGRVEECLFSLTHLEFPAHTHLHLICVPERQRSQIPTRLSTITGAPGQPSQEALLFSAIARRTRHDKAPRMDRLSVQHDNRSFLVHAWSHLTPSNPVPTTVNTSTVLTLELLDRGRSASRMDDPASSYYSHTPSLFDFSELRSLQLSLLQQASEAVGAWDRALRQAKRLECMEIHGVGAISFCSALFRDTETEGRIVSYPAATESCPSRSPQLTTLQSSGCKEHDHIYGFLPSLTSLLIEGTESQDQRPDLDPYAASFEDGLLQFCTRKRHSPTPLQRLIIRRCPFRSEWIDALEKVVEKVEVSGREPW